MYPRPNNLIPVTARGCSQESLELIEDEKEKLGYAVILSASIALSVGNSTAGALWILDHAKSDLKKQAGLREEEEERERDNDDSEVLNNAYKAFVN